MDKSKIKAYKGDGKYVFVSYAHKDSADVLKAIGALNAAGGNTWYDEGIEVGDDWAESIGTSLEKASVVLFFASKSSVKSDNVRRELFFAKEHNIPVVTVMMENFDMPSELERILMVRQAVSLNSYKTYGDFVEGVKPVLTKHGIEFANGTADSDALRQPIVFEQKEKNRKRNTHIVVALIGVAAVLAVAFLLLFKQVPDVIESDYDTAQSKVEDAGFKCTLSLNYSSEYEYGVIFEQSAKGLNLRFIPVVLTQSLGPEENLTVVPDTVTHHLSDGAAMLLDAGMNKFTVVPVSDDKTDRSIITAQSIPAGLRVSRENIMNLDVSSDGIIAIVIDNTVYYIVGDDPVSVDLNNPSNLPSYTGSIDDLYRDFENGDLPGVPGKNGNTDRPGNTGNQGNNYTDQGNDNGDKDNNGDRGDSGDPQNGTDQGSSTDQGNSDSLNQNNPGDQSGLNNIDPAAYENTPLAEIYPEIERNPEAVREYNDEGKLVKTTYADPYSADSSYYVREYDSNGKCIRGAMHLVFNSGSVDIREYIDDYDSNERIVKKTYYNSNSINPNSEEVYSQNIYEYDSNGNCIKATYYAADGTESSDTYEYDQSGNCIAQTYYWNGVVTNRNEYDGSGYPNYPVKNYFYDNDGNVISYCINEYNGNTVKSKYYDADGNLEYESEGPMYPTEGDYGSYMQ